MSNIAVAEILKIHGKWIEGKPFAEFVAQKKRIGERHAYNLIKEASDKHEILRLPLPNRTVLYGLAEFGPPISKEEIENEYLELDPKNALTVAKIDFFLSHPDLLFADKNKPENKFIITCMKLLREWNVKTGKAKGRQ